jgi:2-dehydropantoate 2-reductase
VVGAGAIGGYVAAKLCRAGVDVTVCDRNREHIAAIQQSGLRVSGAADLSEPVRAIDPRDLPQELSTVLLAVKTSATASALETIAPRLASGGCVVSLQNGLQEYLIADRIGMERTVGAFLSFGGHYVGPGELVYGGPGSLRLGELDGARTDRLDRLVALLSLAHPALATENIFGYLWSKTALGAFYFASALSDVNVEELIQSRSHRPALNRLVAEVAEVAHAEGIACEPIDGFSPEAFRSRDGGGIESSWDAQLRYWNGHIQGRTGIWRDLSVHHRETEVAGILLPVLARAARRDISVPLLAATALMVAEAEAGRRPLDLTNVDELAALADA